MNFKQYEQAARNHRKAGANDVTSQDFKTSVEQFLSATLANIDQCHRIMVGFPDHASTPQILNHLEKSMMYVESAQTHTKRLSGTLDTLSTTSMRSASRNKTSFIQILPMSAVIAPLIAPTVLAVRKGLQAFKAIYTLLRGASPEIETVSNALVEISELMELFNYDLQDALKKINKSQDLNSIENLVPSIKMICKNLEDGSSCIHEAIALMVSMRV